MKTYDKWQFGSKLILLFMSAALITGLIGFLGVRNMGKINQLIARIYDDNLVPITFISETSREVINHNRRLCIYVLLSKRSEKEFFKKKMLEDEENVKTCLNMYRRTVLSDEEKTLLAKVDLLWPRYMENAKRTVALSEAGKERDAENIAIGETRQRFQDVDDVLTQLVQVNKNLGKQAYEQSNHIYLESRVYFIVLTLICVGICLVVGLFMSLLITSIYTDVG